MCFSLSSGASNCGFLPAFTGVCGFITGKTKLTQKSTHFCMKNLISDGIQFTKAKNKKQIAEELGIHPNTLARRLKDAGLHVPRGFISPQQQHEIYEILGWCEKVGIGAK